MHVLDWPAADDLWLPLSAQVASARFLGRDGAVRFQAERNGVLLSGIPAMSGTDIDTIIELQLAK
ncbi:MAG: hypothetical protein U0163_10420 [Gemmatimonadaceae bacterium]